MSIFAYTGLPGSGKSYSVVAEQVLPALRAGRMVVTNLPLKWDLLCEDLQIPRSQLREFPAEAVQVNPELIMEAAPAGSVLILDEVWRLFPAGLKANQVPEPYKTAFAEHRHRVNEKGESSQIVLVCQDLAQISAFARQLVETTFRTTKLTSIGVHTRFRIDVFQGPVSGPNPNTASALRQIPGRYDPRIYKYYESHTQSQAGSGVGADERAIDRRANVLMRPLMIAAPAIMLVLAWFGVHQLLKSRAGLGGKGLPTMQAAIGAAVGADRRGDRERDMSRAAVIPVVWKVVAELRGGGGDVGDQAWVSDGQRVVWVPLQFCSGGGRSLRCPYLGQWVGWQGQADSVGVNKPVAAFSSHGLVASGSVGGGVEGEGGSVIAAAGALGGDGVPGAVQATVGGGGGRF